MGGKGGFEVSGSFPFSEDSQVKINCSVCKRLARTYGKNVCRTCYQKRKKERLEAYRNAINEKPIQRNLSA